MSRLGTVEYRNAWHLQERLRDARRDDAIRDTLILLQHPPVITIGRSGNSGNVLAPRQYLTEQGIEVVESNRGGDVTYHGPGQMVAYPILRLSDRGANVPKYVHDIEESAIRLLSEYGISADRRAGFPGIWVGQEKIGFIGIAIRRGITMHGMSLNVDPDLAHFALINPCGLGKPVTSMKALLRRDLDMAEVETRYVACFAEVFGVETRTVAAKELWAHERNATQTS